jgi:hypothetical protein
MSDTLTLNIFNVITDFLTDDPSAEQIIAYRLPEALEARAHDLLERNNEGTLTVDEQQEMYDFIRAEEMMSLLKAKTILKGKRAAG